VWINPANASARLYLAWFYAITGKSDAAVSEAEAVLAHEPYSLKALTALSAMALLRGDYAKAIRIAEDVLSLDPTFGLVKYYLAAALAYDGSPDEALRVCDSAPRDIHEQQLLSLAAFAAIRCGDSHRYEQLRRQLFDDARWPYASYVNRSMALMGAGDIERAQTYLAEGIRRRDPWSIFVHTHPVFSTLPDITRLRRAVQPNRQTAKLLPSIAI
jgi:tetratricopeptide (TPR) repeat protein